ncbi:MAG: type VI secretion system lipoprotein TssJ, partial [Comamonadaceae bacterium]
MSTTQNAISRRTILKTAPLLTIAGASLAGCGVVNTLNRPTEAPTAVPSAIIEIMAERSLNPDVDGMPK